MGPSRRPGATRQAHDLKPQQCLVLQVPPVTPGGKPEEIQITLEHKSGRAARLVVEAQATVSISRKS